MSITHNVATLLQEHVTLEVEGIDRMYLNVYVPRLQWEEGVVGFFQKHRRDPLASSALMEPISRGFVRAIESFVQKRAIPVVQFEKGQRENLDLGRPDQIQLVFGRRVTKATPGRFRTRVITDGVTPSLHVDYKNSRIKQYHKEGRALRTETTINNTRDFFLGKRLCHLAALRQVGFQANRRLLEVERLSHDCLLGEAALQQVNCPREVNGQHVPALRSTDPRVLLLWSAPFARGALRRGAPWGAPPTEGWSRIGDSAD